MKQSPIIIIGMHRSGTSLTSQILEQLGLFTGMRKDSNYEPYFFKRLNKYILASLGASWDNPLPYHHINNHDDLSQHLSQQLATALTNPSAISYYGLTAYFKKLTGIDINNKPWGWKDPRNTFTLPLWLRLFPEAKVIHVTRHGVDVAQSLQARSLKELSRSKHYNILQHQLIASGVLPQDAFKLVGSARCLDINEGVKLWSEYMEEGRRHSKRLGKQCLTIKYENLLQQADQAIPMLANFCSLPCETSTLNRLTSEIKADRAYAYQQRPELQAIAEQSKDLLAKFSY